MLMAAIVQLHLVKQVQELTLLHKILMVGMRGVQLGQITLLAVHGNHIRQQRYTRHEQMEQQHIVILALLYQQQLQKRIQLLLVIQFHITQMGMELPQVHKPQLIPLNTLLMGGEPQQVAELKPATPKRLMLQPQIVHYMPNIRTQERKEALYFQPLQRLGTHLRVGIKKLLVLI